MTDDRIHRSVRKGGRQPLADLGGVGARADVALSDAGQVLEAQLGGAAQRPLAIVHRDRSYRPAISPPSTATSCPVTYDARSEARKATSAPSSSGFP